MAYDEGLAERLRGVYQDVENVTEKRMFGGLAFMVRGNMSSGVIKDELMVRVGRDLYDEALARKGAKPMDFTGRPMRGFVTVLPQGYESDEALEAWLNMSLKFVNTLPSK